MSFNPNAYLIKLNMAPKKVYKRKEMTTAESGKKKKLVIKGKLSSSGDANVPPGFPNISLENWVESAHQKTLRTCSARSAVRVPMNVGGTIDGLPMGGLTPTEPDHSVTQSEMASPNSQGTESAKLGGRELQKAYTDVILLGWKETIKEILQETDNLNGSKHLENFNTSSADKPEPDVYVSPYSQNIENGINPSSPMEKNSMNMNSDDQEQTQSITLTEVAQADDCLVREEDEVQCPTLVTVAGCRLKEEFAHTARIIEKMRGDILAESLFKGTLRSSLFDKVCVLYQKLEKVKFSVITVSDLELMKKDVHDLLIAKVDVGWLDNRLDEILHAKNIVVDVPNMKERRIKEKEMISEFQMMVRKMEIELQEAQKKLESAKEGAEKTRQAHIMAKDFVKRFFNKSLVDGMF